MHSECGRICREAFGEGGLIRGGLLYVIVSEVHLPYSKLVRYNICVGYTVGYVQGSYSLLLYKHCYSILILDQWFYFQVSCTHGGTVITESWDGVAPTVARCLKS